MAYVPGWLVACGRWLSRVSRVSRRRTSCSRHQPPAYHPHLDALEDRLTPAAAFYTNSGTLLVTIEPQDPRYEAIIGASSSLVQVNSRTNAIRGTASGKLKAADVRGIVVVGSKYDDNIDLSGVTPKDYRNLNGKISVNGNAGNDTIRGSAFNDILIGGLGNDKIYGMGGNDTLQGDNGNDALDGGDGNDFLDSGAGDDQMRGGNGNDTLLGRNGNDTMDGGAGDDRMVGGAGNDSFRGGAGKDAFVGGMGYDRVYDIVFGELKPGDIESFKKG